MDAFVVGGWTFSDTHDLHRRRRSFQLVLHAAFILSMEEGVVTVAVAAAYLNHPLIVSLSKSEKLCLNKVSTLQISSCLKTVNRTWVATDARFFKFRKLTQKLFLFIFCQLWLLVVQRVR